MARITFTQDFADSPFRVGFQRGVGYVVVEVETGAIQAEFEGNAVGYTAAYELAADLNLERRAELADSAAALAELTEINVAAPRFAVGDLVRVTSPTAPDFGVTGTVAAVHCADSDCPSYLVSFGEYLRPYGGGELTLAPVATPTDQAVFAARSEALGAPVCLWRFAGTARALSTYLDGQRGAA